MSKVGRKKMNDRHRLMALCVASGMKQRDIAKQLGVTETTVSIVVNTPLFRALVDQHRKQIAAEGARNVIDTIMADGATNVRFLQDVRDGAVDDADVGDRVRASGMLLDRQAPKRTESDSTKTMIFRVEGDVRQRIESAIDEDEPIDVESSAAFTLPPVEAVELEALDAPMPDDVPTE